ncbi:MAG: Histidine triad protein [Candidatus Jorgensenbacteria bacterium GW2011_GWA2_45_13]|uniref:Histidine triad protein n=1 Tax=Candidatus Jorgensenbacteria bacterium GW2011_GWA2_45_13 TaxID=1618662 RepID=A0A0G1L880_9BACT|nr:MAG: Histidine triad protein [Candidatus Jorgensenbacteria bacterium GW2011_GWA2_45_13]
MNCLFCKIINKEISAESVHEDDHTLAILDVHPRTLGHVLVLPKVHSTTILDLPSEEIGPVFYAVKAVTEKLRRALSPDGFTIGINHGKTAGQAVEHLHIHIIPRWADDGGSSIHGIVMNPPKESLEQVAKKINK